MFKRKEQYTSINFDSTFVQRKLKSPPQAHTKERKKFYLRGALPSVKRKSTSSLLLAFFVIFLVMAGVLLFNIKNTTFRINGITYSDSEKMNSEVKEYLKTHGFFSYNSNDLSYMIKKNNPLVQEAFVSKSFLFGTVIDVKELQPKAIIIDKDSVKYTLVYQNKLVPFVEVNQKLPVLFLEGSVSQDEELLFVNNALKVVQMLQEAGYQGKSSFDLFGNLSILTVDSKEFKFDLKESYYTVGEQVTALKTIMKNVGIDTVESVDLRFKYQVVKKLKS